MEERPGKKRLVTILALLVGVATLLVALLQVEALLRPESDSSAVKLSILPGLPKLTLREGSLYPKDDPWTSYLAGEKTCPGGERTDLSLNEQADVLACLINYAREKRGLSALAIFPLLNKSSLTKAQKIAGCNDFDHDACGEDPARDARDEGYDGAWGENLYLGEKRLGAPRVALDGWLNSSAHRDNLFRPEWRSQGIAAMRVDSFDGYSDVTIWVSQFATG